MRIKPGQKNIPFNRECWIISRVPGFLAVIWLVSSSTPIPLSHTVIRFVWVSAKFDTCTVVCVNGTLVEDKMRGFKGECAHFSFNKRPIYTHAGASAEFSTNSQETDNSAPVCKLGRRQTGRLRKETTGLRERVGEEVEEELYGTTARKPGLQLIFQYSLPFPLPTSTLCWNFSTIYGG